MAPKKETKPKSLKARFVKWLTGYNPELFEAQQTLLKGSISVLDSNNFNETYLFDFKNYSSQYSGVGVFGTPGRVATGSNDADLSPEDSDHEQMSNAVKKGQDGKVIKLAVKPKDVLIELETIPTPFSLLLIDEKLSVLQDKVTLITQSYAKREVTALIQRLENRKKYQQYRVFFDSFQNTTDEKIDALLAKYDLVMKTSDIFIPEFPDDAIKTMKEYTEHMNLICELKPVFYVIAEPDKFRKAYEKRESYWYKAHLASIGRF